MDRQSNLRERILALLASSAVLGGTSCGGVAQQVGPGASGSGQAGAPSHAGTSAERGGEGSVGGAFAGTASVGGSNVGGSNVGGSGEGGWSYESIPPGGRNCSDSGVGVCCDYDRCFAPGDVLASFAGATFEEAADEEGAGGDSGAAGEGGAAGGGGAAGTKGSLCPTINAFWLCGSVHSPPVEKNGSCCYVVTEGSCCGRPFLVGGQMRLPEIASGSPWASAHFRLDAQSLEPELRRALAEGWLEDAQLEHASIAAFARFVLQLLAFGAPADLVQGAQSALADEIRHANVCFALASHYAGLPLAAGPLDVSGSLATLDLASVAALVVTEGCIGETVAATLAAEQALAASDPQIKKILQGIAEDEARHAELAWRFVQWAMGRGGQPVWDAVAAAFAAGAARTASCSSLPEGDRLRAHGRFGALNRRKYADWAVRECVAPCAQFLLSERSAPSRA